MNAAPSNQQRSIPTRQQSNSENEGCNSLQHSASNRRTANQKTAKKRRSPWVIIMQAYSPNELARNRQSGSDEITGVLAQGDGRLRMDADVTLNAARYNQ
jgi:hypothetical protein